MNHGGRYIVYLSYVGSIAEGFIHDFKYSQTVFSTDRPTLSPIPVLLETTFGAGKKNREVIVDFFKRDAVKTTVPHASDYFLPT